MSGQVAAGGAGEQGETNRVIPAVSDAIRVGLCGIGRTGFGRIRKELLGRGEFQMAAGFDLLPERGREFAEKFSAVAAPTFEALIHNPRVELVIIATRSDTHAALAIQALAAGKHVVVEKPMAVNLAEADKLIVAAKQAKGRLFVRHNRRFDAGFRFVQEQIAAGKVGTIHGIQIRVGEYVRRTDWQTLKQFGGGQLLNWGPHVIDWALELLGGEVVGQWSDLKLITAAGDSEDHVKLILKGKSGAVADIEISGANASRQPMLVVNGERGALTLLDEGHATIRYLRIPPNRAALIASAETPRQDDKRYKADDASEWIEENGPAEPAAGGAYAVDFWAALYATLRRNKPFPVTLERAREVMRIIQVAREGTPF